MKLYLFLMLVLFSSFSFAEISDKMPSFIELIIEYIILSALSFWCIYKLSKWAYLILPIAIFWAYFSATDDFGPGEFYKAVIDEMGIKYAYFRWHGLIIMLFISIISAIALIYIKRKSK
jgi:hypothetical protein